MATSELPVRRDRPRPGPSQVVTFVTGVLLVGVAAAGLTVTGLDDFAHHASGDEVLGFEVNPLQNVVHLVFGIFGLVAWVRLSTSLLYGALLAVGYGGRSCSGCTQWARTGISSR